MKMRESLGYDPKPDDLIMSKVKSFERKMEACTVAMYMCSDDL
jgi:hypothetical protein